MSNAMSRSKSRWKSALLAGAAIAVMTPLAAKAQSMTVGIYANPLGGGSSTNVYSGLSNVYIDPYDTDTLYVYATVTGTAAPSASYVDGLQYLYYNVNAAATGAAGVTGSITAATPSSLFGGGNFNQTTNNPGAGAQGGAISSITTTPGIVVGSSSTLGSIAKPRASSTIYNTGTSSGSSVVVSGNSVSFLVETLTYTPNSAAVLATPSTPGAANSLAFNVSVPAISTLYGSQYAPANYFVGLPSNPGLGTSPGAANTSTGYAASSTNLSLTNALSGDATLDGTVNFSDLGEVLTHYNATDTKWTDGNFLYGSNPSDTVINFSDLGLVLTNYNSSLGSGPSDIVADTALLDDPAAVALLKADGITPVSAVPEPASIALIGILGAGALVRRRR